MGKKGKERSSRIREGRRQREGRTRRLYTQTPDATTQLGVVGKVSPVFGKKFTATRLRAGDSARFPRVEGRICGRINGGRGKGGCISNFHSNARYTCCQRRAAFAMRSFSPSLFLPLYIPTYYAEERQLSRQVFQFFQQGGGQSCGG